MESPINQAIDAAFETYFHESRPWPSINNHDVNGLRRVLKAFAAAMQPQLTPPVQPNATRFAKGETVRCINPGGEYPDVENAGRLAVVEGYSKDKQYLRIVFNGRKTADTYLHVYFENLTPDDAKGVITPPELPKPTMTIPENMRSPIDPGKDLAAEMVRQVTGYDKRAISELPERLCLVDAEQCFSVYRDGGQSAIDQLPDLRRMLTNLLQRHADAVLERAALKMRDELTGDIDVGICVDLLRNAKTDLLAPALLPKKEEEDG